MLYKEINKRFTEIVVEYMAKGYYINTASQSGSQGEIAKVDVTDGKEIIRILIDNFNSWDDNTSLEGIEIVVGKVAENDRVTPNSTRTWGTIWNNHLEVISEEKFYQVGRENRCGSKNYGTHDEAVEAQDKRYDRYRMNRQSDGEHIFSQTVHSAVLPFVKRQPKCKTARLADIEKVYSVVNTSRFSNGKVSKSYYVVARGKRYKLG